MTKCVGDFFIHYVEEVKKLIKKAKKETKIDRMSLVMHPKWTKARQLATNDNVGIIHQVNIYRAIAYMYINDRI